MHLTVGRTAMRLIDSDFAWNVDPGIVDVRMTFSSSSRVVFKLCSLVQCFEIIDSSNPGTYQTSDS